MLEEIKMVEDTPDDLVHELFAGGFWPNHPLGRPILGQPDNGVGARSARSCARYFADAYVAPNFVVAAVGNLEHAHVRDLVERRFRGVPVRGSAIHDVEPVAAAEVVVRSKDLEQSHVCFGTPALSYGDQRSLRVAGPQHDARRLDELAAVPERAREARPGLCGVLRA